ncbi:MAG: NADH-quinone oxidoreductase subunit C [Acidobacteria bacterium]|nr:NADH-quinone oxidoreductase subunit C [Acidobacteriota bacterium]
MESRALVAALETLVPGARVEALPSVDQPTVLGAAADLVAVGAALRDGADLRFAALIDIVGVDMMPRVPRFDVNYVLVATSVPARVRVKVQVDGDEPHVPSVTGIWPSAGFLEREVWDLLGVVFDGHPDLRRLLTPDDWEGHPLRKDYPVQVKVPVKFHEPLQVTEDQFKANIEQDRRVRGDQS